MDYGTLKPYNLGTRTLWVLVSDHVVRGLMESFRTVELLGPKGARVSDSGFLLWVLSLSYHNRDLSLIIWLHYCGNLS